MWVCYRWFDLWVAGLVGYLNLCFHDFDSCELLCLLGWFALRVWDWFAWWFVVRSGIGFGLWLLFGVMLIVLFVTICFGFL